ncbi:hypothetical protein Tco_0185041 [Tanacetum coccineum]
MYGETTETDKADLKSVVELAQAVRKVMRMLDANRWNFKWVTWSFGMLRIYFVEFITLLPVSNHKEMSADEIGYPSLEEIQLDVILHFIDGTNSMSWTRSEGSSSKVYSIVKVRWNSRRGPEYTWEREDFFKRNYPHLFSSNKKTRLRNRAPGRRSLKEGRM